MCNSCNSCGGGCSLFGNIGRAIQNLFGCPCNSQGGNNGNGGCGCGCGGANGVNPLNGTVGLNGNGGCGNFDCYYARQYALYPFNTTGGNSICSCC